MPPNDSFSSLLALIRGDDGDDYATGHSVESAVRVANWLLLRAKTNRTVGRNESETARPRASDRILSMAATSRSAERESQALRVCWEYSGPAEQSLVCLFVRSHS